MITSPAYQEMVDFLAEANPQSLIDFRLSAASKARVINLIRQEKTEGLSREERSDLDHHLQLEHLMRLAKAKARQHLGASNI